jgi:hypothetical protein
MMLDTAAHTSSCTTEQVGGSASSASLSAGAPTFVPKATTDAPSDASADSTMPAEHGENRGPSPSTASPSTASTNNRGNSNKNNRGNSNNSNNNESGSVDRNKNKSSSRGGGGGGGKSSSSRRKGQAFTPASKSLFFQSVTGEYIYLHPFNVKCLLHQYGKVQNFPGTCASPLSVCLCAWSLRGDCLSE